MAHSGGHCPYESEGVDYTLIGGNHVMHYVMHFRQFYLKKLALGAIIFHIEYVSVLRRSNDIFVCDYIMFIYICVPDILSSL